MTAPVTGSHPLPRGATVVLRAQWRGGPPSQYTRNAAAFWAACAQFADSSGFARAPSVTQLGPGPYLMTLGQDLQPGDVITTVTMKLGRDTTAAGLRAAISNASTGGVAVAARSFVVADQGILPTTSPSAGQLVLSDIANDPMRFLSDVGEAGRETLSDVAEAVKPALIPLAIVAGLLVLLAVVK